MCTSIYIINSHFIPTAQSEPVQPVAQLQVSGAEHIPPFSQAVVQIAVNHSRITRYQAYI